MGKTFEAMDKAENKRDAKALEVSIKPRQEPADRPPRVENCQKAADCYEDLKINLLARHPEKSIKTILFSGTTHGDGSSTTAINFATTLAKSCLLKVLLIEANLRTPSLQELFHLEPHHGLSDLLTNGSHPEAILKKVGTHSLYVVTPGARHAPPVSLFESKPFCEFLTSMREKFDYIILDGPPLLSFTESRVLCAKVDGVVMVLASGTTRRQVAARTKKEIEEAGGKVLGMVLNKRKFHIPRWLYRML
jgi:protein-tyrosine kinase